jgi:hypothetical protein
MREIPEITQYWRKIQKCVNFSGNLPYCCDRLKANIDHLLLFESVISETILKESDSETASRALVGLFSRQENSKGTFTLDYPHIRDYLVTEAPVSVISTVLGFETTPYLKSLHRDISNFVLDREIPTIRELPRNRTFLQALKILLLANKDTANRNTLLDEVNLYEL